MSAHRPGPWFLEGNWDASSGKALGGWVSSNPPIGSPLFELIPITGDPAEIVANARVLVAAPEILEALRGLERIVTAFGHTNVLGKTQAQRLEAARKTIAKAEGRP